MAIADRYATAAFDVFLEESTLERLEDDIDLFANALATSPELRQVINSPIITRPEQRATVETLAAKMGLSQEFKNLLSLMAERRRLFVLEQLFRRLRDRITAHRGEVTAEVTSAAPLSASQSTQLAEILSKRFEKAVTIKPAVDASVIGGLIVKVGSFMIDTSIASQLNFLHSAMKESE